MPPFREAPPSPSGTMRERQACYPWSFGDIHDPNCGCVVGRSKQSLGAVWTWEQEWNSPEEGERILDRSPRPVTGPRAGIFPSFPPVPADSQTLLTGAGGGGSTVSPPWLKGGLRRPRPSVGRQRGPCRVSGRECEGSTKGG